MSLPRQMLMLAIAASVILGAQCSFATPSLEISTSKKTYEYGDFLSINFQVSEITGSDMVIHITDSSNKSSAPINLPVYKANSTITSPFPFYKTTFSPGTYRIDAEYSGASSSVSFDLVDSGKIAIPVEFKTLVTSWQQGSVTDKNYADVIREMINNNILSIPNYSQANQTHIPQWFKNNFKLWADGDISDNEFGMATIYLIQNGIVRI